ncbi:fibronectin type III domain-containing protein [Lactococcus formosensis]|uniref:Fibronectin type III domain-containing protein n=1 Tax=Lactococcus formosensis TaxID=1281486 RepID=A0A9X4NYD3_9LACT|nr:fibronectin type III domain-containing protein [Lactococcus formosensis]MDG6145879.1 fibronectin type III domain-containing protein [Lactococcus formosensis]MDG6176360.1 fibronectin type III domain-containing protein [Lactococcus formosensis]
MATNYNHIAYSKSADGKEGFTTLYPNLNLLSNSNFDKGLWDDEYPRGTYNLIPPEKDKPTKNILHGIKSTVGNQQIGAKPLSIYVEKDKNYTISFDYRDKGFTTSKTLLVIRAFDTENPTSTGSANSLWEQTFTHSIFGISTESSSFQSISTIFKAKSDGWLSLRVYDSDSSGNHESWYRDIKIEQGSISTPCMPHESEVTSQDYPTYIGTYTDENQNSSASPEDYTWEMMNYRIYLDGIAVAGSKLLSTRVENLKPDTSYTIQVKQVSGEEESDFSDSVTFKTNVQK